jgi:hypothetical protein
MVHVLSFLHQSRATSFFRETSRKHMDYGVVYMNFFV